MYKTNEIFGNLRMMAESGGAALGKPHEKAAFGSILVGFCGVGYTESAATPKQAERGGRPMKEIILFLISVAASVVAYYICKWLDGEI